MDLCRWATILVVCSGLGTSHAAAEGYAALTGHILDTSQGGIAGASITVTSQDTGFRRIGQSQLGGAYTVGSLDPGVYKITVRKDGFRTLVRFGLTLTGATGTAVDFTLPVGSMLETITVEGTAPPFERQDASAGTQYDAAEIQRLPLNGGGLLELLDAVPGTNVTPATRGEAGQFTASGQRANANYFIVDGVSGNNGVAAGGIPAQSTGGSLPAVSAFGSLDALISLDAVGEFSVRTSSTGAPMGRLPGAQVVLNSQGGSNAFHGASLFRFRNEALAANNWFSNAVGFDRSSLRLYNTTETLGGPVRRNHTFFFLSYQHMDLLQPFVWNQAVPSEDARATANLWAVPILPLFPLPNHGNLVGGAGEWVGVATRPAALDAGSARIDQAIGSRVSLFARYNDAPSSNQFGNLAVNILDLRSQTLTIGLTARVSPNVALETRLNESFSSAHSSWTSSNNTSGPGCQLQPLTGSFLIQAQNCDYLVRVTIGGIGQLVSGREGDRRQRQFQALQSASFYHGRHAIEMGVDFRRITPIRRDAAGSLSVLVDSVADLPSRNNLWIGHAPPLQQSVELAELSLWAQDTWRVSPRFTLNAGLRWEFSPAPTASVYFLNLDTSTFSQQTRELWPLTYRNFAPRLGLAWQLTGDGRTVLRAGGGLYYDSSVSIATDFVNDGPLDISSATSSMGGVFSTQLTYGFMPDLRLPAVGQWNLSLERAISTHDVISLGYVGSAAYDLIRRELGGPGFTPTSWVVMTTNNGRSRYHALEAQYRRHFAHSVEALVSYTWSHSIDNDSSDAFLLWAGPGAGPSRDRGSSDFDLRHSFTASASYSAPARLGGFLLSGILRVRSGFPITVLNAEEYTGVSFINAFRPNLVAGPSQWLNDGNAPGGKSLNPAAFQAIPGKQGTLGRNALTGFGMWQVDLALSREFKLFDRAALELRAEAFNVLNHPNFADPLRYLNSPLFGQSPSMLNMMLGTGSPGSGLSPVLGSGGPRELQLGVRFRF